MLLKQIRSSPAALGAARPARQPEAAGCQRVARTCDGDAKSWPPSLPGRRGTGPDGLCAGRHQCGLSSLSLDGENLSGAERNPRVRLSETRDRDARASRLRSNVTPARYSLVTWVVPGS
jgi:hypothetical protein